MALLTGQCAGIADALTSLHGSVVVSWANAVPAGAIQNRKAMAKDFMAASFSTWLRISGAKVIPGIADAFSISKEL
jgi:hypothetical protein